MKKELLVEVTLKRFYLFPSNLFNQSAKGLIKEFFEDFDINQHHASRDYHRITEKVVKIKHKTINPDNLKKEIGD